MPKVCLCGRYIFDNGYTLNGQLVCAGCYEQSIRTATRYQEAKVAATHDFAKPLAEEEQNPTYCCRTCNKPYRRKSMKRGMCSTCYNSLKKSESGQ